MENVELNNVLKEFDKLNESLNPSLTVSQLNKNIYTWIKNVLDICSSIPYENSNFDKYKTEYLTECLKYFTSDDNELITQSFVDYLSIEIIMSRNGLSCFFEENGKILVARIISYLPLSDLLDFDYYCFKNTFIIPTKSSWIQFSTREWRDCINCKYLNICNDFNYNNLKIADKILSKEVDEEALYK